MAKAMNFSIKLRERTQRGFSLLELSIAMVILAVVIAVIVSGVTQLQKTNASQAINVDLTQESRQFMDQIVEDLTARRERWDISYYLVHEPYLDDFAPVVARLAGK